MGRFSANGGYMDTHSAMLGVLGSIPRIYQRRVPVAKRGWGAKKNEMDMWYMSMLSPNYSSEERWPLSYLQEA